ncbi:thioredoxin [Nitzschia inconspicua]|uniref:Thioredoxin n=1 Tax=Nitzschia inconspicua TaxID=303405 RepID=A0A9K3L3Q5_9STRA|nr:thioredoxin [Nitzschia inconspicua]
MLSPNLLIALCSLAAVLVGKTSAFQNSIGMCKQNAFLPQTADSGRTSLSVSSTAMNDSINDTMNEYNFMKKYQESLLLGPPHDQSTLTTTSQHEIPPPPITITAIPEPATSTTIGSQQQQKQQVHSITSMQELISVMNGQRNLHDDQLTVIKFYADYCKLCQRAGIQMKRLVTEFPTVDFTKIEQNTLTAPAADTLRALGVTKFPWVQIYRHGNCVASFSTGPSHMFMKRVRDTVTMCLERSPEAWQEFEQEFASNMAENAATRQKLMAYLDSSHPQSNMGA